MVWGEALKNSSLVCPHRSKRLSSTSVNIISTSRLGLGPVFVGISQAGSHISPKRDRGMLVRAKQGLPARASFPSTGQ